ncbi:MAG: hypothetical protein KGQ54_04575, partial [Verrucomicrobia bacterium]|nr:hypothetical protein [Verrucomicrobiota bacterium]
LFDHDALCVPLHYTDKKKIGGFLSTVPWAQTGIDHDGFARAMSALTGKRLIISDPSSSRKAIFRVVDCMTKGFTCSKEIIDTVAGHLMTEKYNPETFQRELGFYLMGHVRSEKQQIYRSNLETFLEKLPESPETVLVREILQKLLPPNHYGNTLLTLLKEESNLKLNECLDIQTSKGVFLRSFTEHQQILETLSTNKESCLDLICRLQKGEYPRLFDCLDYCMTKGLVTLEEQVIIIQSFIHGVDPTKKQNAIAGVLDCLVKKTSFENTDLVLTLSILLKDKEATQFDPSLLLLDDVLCSLKIDQTLLHKVRCGLLKKVGISHLPAIKKLQWIQEKTIEGMRAIEILEEELANEENRSVCLKALESLDSMLVPCLAKKIFEKKLFSVLQAFPMEHVKSAIFDLSFDELLEALDSQSFTQRQFDPFLDLVNERISICLSSIDPKALKNRLNALSPSFRNTFIIDRQLFKTLHKRDARELLDLKNLDGVSTESLIWFFGFMIKDKKRLDPFEGEMLAKIIERQEDQLVCPKLFEKLGNLLLSLDEIPTETCLVLFRTFPSDEEQNYPDWIKLVLLKFYSTKSAASTPINEFRGILKSPISSRFSKEISPLSTPFFTNSLKQMLQSKDLDHKLVIPKIFRFCPIDEKEAIRTFNEILTTTTNFETINVRLEDLLSLAVEMAEVSPKVSLEYFDLLANFLYEGVKKGNTYSYERIFLTFFEGLAKSYPFLASHPTSGARIKRLVTMMTQVVFDGKNRDVLDWMAGARGKFGLEVMPQDSLV